MTKKHDLAKRALKHPELFTEGELNYFRLWLRAREQKKKEKKELEKLERSDYLK
jgi:hypothetical protein